MVGFIPIYKKDSFNLKIVIYYQIMRIITKSKCSNKYLLIKFPSLYFENWLDIITLKSKAVKNLLIIYVVGNIQ